MSTSRANSPATAVTVCVAVFSCLTGFLAGMASFNGRLAVVETEYKQVAQVQSDVHQLREDVSRIAAKVGASAPTVATVSLTHPFMVKVWDSALTRRCQNCAKHSGN